QPSGFKDDLLRVQPDILPPGSVRLEEVWIEGERHADFDANTLTVRLPKAKDPLHVRVRLAPAQRGFDASVEQAGHVAKLTLVGRLEPAAIPVLEAELAKAIALRPRRLALLLQDLESVSSAGLRALIGARHRFGVDLASYLVGARKEVI